MKKKCKVCNNEFIDNIFLGKHPCADTFIKSKVQAISLKKYPLVVGFCNCSHLTALYPVPPYERYQKFEYSYTSSNSIVSRSHFRDIALKISKKFKLDSNSLVVEAGSNDGTFLLEIKNISKSKVIGVDPSKNINELARKKKIFTICDYFNLKTSKKIISKFGYADIFYGANVFNHLDDNINFLKSVLHLLKNDGILILEVPDLRSLIDTVGFDTIYHEHRHYYSENSLYKILLRENFFIFKIEKIKYMSGSIRVYATKRRLIASKLNLDFVSIKEFNKFKIRVNIVINAIKHFVDKNIKNNNVVYGIGAATKGNTLLNCCNFNNSKIKYILETSKYKIGKFTPGSAIKIVNEKKYKKKIKAVLILPWNITSYLKKRLFKNKKIIYISIQKVVRQLFK